MTKFLFMAVFTDTDKAPAAVIFDADIPVETINSIYHKRHSLVRRLCERFNIEGVNPDRCSITPVGDITVRLGTRITFDGYDRPVLDHHVVKPIEQHVH